MIPRHHISGWYSEEEWGSGETQWMAKDAILEVKWALSHRLVMVAGHI